jgi:O-antigen/teichoic acid export membrane protein
MTNATPTATIARAPTAATLQQRDGVDAHAGNAPPDLKRQAARGAVVSTGAQVATLVLRTASLMILARLLLKEDFGLVSMATVFTGFLGLLRDAGLSDATVQRASITTAQTSTLFWVNVAVGGLLAILTTATAPLLTTFYGDGRLFWITVAVGASFVFNGAAAQHRAILRRDLRFSALATTDLVSLCAAIALGLGMALAGYRYWALVGMAITQPAITAAGVWVATGWVPGKPQRRSGIGPMLAYGGAVTLNTAIVYLAYNVDKVLIGRFWGADALGTYGRAFQLVTLPNEILFATLGQVAFPAFSRVQNDLPRLRSYFLKGYGVFVSLVMPITIGSALFADDIVRVLLGTKWLDAAVILRLLSPTILAFAVAHPFGSLMLARGRVDRALTIALVVSPALILSYILGLSRGPQGVAMAFSITMVLAIAPVALLATRGTSITMGDLVTTVKPAFISVAITAAALLAVQPMVKRAEPALVRLIAECGALLAVYLFTFLYIMKQKPIYMRLLRETALWPVKDGRPATSGA